MARMRAETVREALRGVGAERLPAAEGNGACG